MKYVAGIDIGTSSCKTVLVDASGVLVATSSMEYFAKPGDNADMDPMDWWNAAVTTLKSACEKIGISPAQIGAVGCSGQMQGCTFIGKDKKPVRDSMLWYGTSPKEICARLNQEYGDVFLRNCQSLSMPSLTGSKIRWVMEHEPEVWAKTDKFLFAPSFIGFMLTGEAVVDRSELGLSGLNNVVEGEWSKELMDITGVTAEKMPALMDSIEIMGTVTKEAAGLTGLLEGTPVIAGCGDGPAESFSVNIAGKSEMKLRLGSACAANAVIPKDWLGTKVQYASPYADREHYHIGNFTSNCALAVKWVRDTFFSELKKEDKSYSLMDAEAKDCKLGSGGLLFHPYLNGEAAHYADPWMTAKFTGITINCRRSDFLHAVYEGVSFSIRDMVEHNEGLALMENVVFCGGGTKSSVWMPILLDVLGRDGVIPKSGDASFGVALMAGQAIGLFDAAKAADASRDAGRAVTFNAENHQRYNKIYQKYLDMVKI